MTTLPDWPRGKSPTIHDEKVRRAFKGAEDFKKEFPYTFSIGAARAKGILVEDARTELIPYMQYKTSYRHKDINNLECINRAPDEQMGMYFFARYGGGIPEVLVGAKTKERLNEVKQFLRSKGFIRGKTISLKHHKK